MFDKATGPCSQQFQDRLEGIVGYLLKIDKQRIEYKPQFAVPLLEMPPAHNEGDRPATVK